MRIEADTEVCIGAGQCVMTAPELFDRPSGHEHSRDVNPSRSR